MVRDELTPGTLIQLGRYRVDQLLGRGGFGAVYRAEQLATGQQVALKVLLVDRADGVRSQREIGRFTREMKLVGQISHPNVVRLIDFGQLEDGRLFTAFEYSAGQNLADLVDREGPVPVRECRRLMRQVLEALAAAHKQGVIHRDLKPQNIMVTDHGPRANAMVVDFGVSFIAEDRRDTDYRTLTAGDEVAGTPHYMAPEQLLYGKASVKSDIYAWGLVFLEALTGSPAYAETSFVKLLLRHTRSIPPDIPSLLVESDLGPILARATAFSPDTRYADACEALEALEAIDPRGARIDELERQLRDNAISWRAQLDARSQSSGSNPDSPAGPLSDLSVDALPVLTPSQPPNRASDQTELATPPRPTKRETPPPPIPALAPTLPKVPSGPRAIPDKPSLIVLPFANLSGDPEQEFFADGLTEDVLTALSRFHELFVISRNTAFKYKGQAVEVGKVARELSVQYVVEGSVRKAGNRVRISVQLVDAEVDRHVWAERYDRELEDIFAIQDEVTAAIVATLAGRVEAANRKRAAQKPTEAMAAYECVLAGKVLHHRSNRADNAEALRLFERAIAIDPSYAHAWAWKACTTGQAFTYGWLTDFATFEKAMSYELETALGLDDNDSDVHRILAAVCIAQNLLEKAVHHQQRALALNPNDDLIVVQQGELLTWLGQPDEGIVWIRKAMRLNPFHPPRFWSHLGRAYFTARRYAEAIEAFHAANAPDLFHHAVLAACHLRLGDPAATSRHVAAVLACDSGFRVQSHLQLLHYKIASDTAHYGDALLEAGLPA